MNRNEYKALLSESDYDAAKIPQAFFTLRDIRVGHDLFKHDLKNKEKMKDNLEFFIKDDIIEHIEFSCNYKYLITCTVTKQVSCYATPQYNRKWKCKINLSPKIAKIKHPDVPLPPTCISTVALHNSGEHFAVGLATGHLLFYSIKMRKVKARKMKLTDDEKPILTHSIQAHIDYISVMNYTPFGRLMTGGADSNIKIFSHFAKETVSPEYVFIKHCDEIDFIQVLESKAGSGETVASGDKTGTVFLWIIGKGRAQKMVNLGDNALWGCFGLVVRYSKHSASMMDSKTKEEAKENIEEMFKANENYQGGIINVQLYNGEYRLEKYNWDNELEHWQPIKASELSDDFERSRTGFVASDFFFLNSKCLKS